jgi:DNA-binding CsgD family transcriptional regulator
MVLEEGELSAVIGDIYDAAVEPVLWEKALASVCNYVGGSSAALYWHDSATERSAVLHSYNFDPYYLKIYFEKYLPLNPMFPAELNKTRFYKEWIEPQGTLGALSVNLEKGMARASMINVRMTVPLVDKMRRRLALLAPHLQRAVAIGKLFDQSKATEQALGEALDHVEAAVFLVGAKAQIVFANENAKRMLNEGVLVKKQSNSLCAVAPGANRALRTIFLAAEKGDTSLGIRGVAVALTDELPNRWFAHVLPLTSGRRQQIGNNYAAVAAAFIRRTSPNALSPLEGVSKSYGLTASEVRVLDAVLKTTSIKAMAELLGVSQATVKTHLHHLFRKTKTKRQVDLLKLIAGL